MKPPEYQDDLDRGIDYYDVLGVEVTAPEVEIVSAYRARIRTVHPDVGGDHDEAALLIRAKGVLAGKDRAAYDAARERKAYAARAAADIASAARRAREEMAQEERQRVAAERAREEEAAREGRRRAEARRMPRDVSRPPDPYRPPAPQEARTSPSRPTPDHTRFTPREAGASDTPSTWWNETSRMSIEWWAAKERAHEEWVAEVRRRHEVWASAARQGLHPPFPESPPYPDIPFPDSPLSDGGDPHGRRLRDDASETERRTRSALYDVLRPTRLPRR